jgi:hypothetical protein
MRVLTLAAFVIPAAIAATAAAQPKPPPRPVPKIEKAPPPPALVGLEAKGAFAPERGFIDDVVASDAERLGIVVTDGAAQVEVQLVSNTDLGEIARLDVAKLMPSVRRFYLRGDALFLVGGSEDGSPVAGVLVGLDGKVRKAQKPATDHHIRPFAGVDAVYSYHVDRKARGGVQHQLEVFDLLKGKKLSKKPGRLLLGKDGRDARLDFTPAYFTDGMTVAVGTRGGIWRKKEDQRSPDTAASLDLLTGKWIKDEPIVDLLGRARHLEIMTEHKSSLFVRPSDDKSAIEIWRDGVARPITLDQPFEVYDPSSLAYARKGDALWLSLVVDPVNGPAVARRKADPEYLDLFVVEGDRAVRKARILATKKKLRWGWVGERLWVMEKNVGFDRGSKLLTLYALSSLPGM